MRRVAATLSLILLAFVLLPRVACAQADTAVKVGHVADSDIRLDGRLDERIWQHAPAVRLIQQDPDPGAPTPFKTTVYLLHSRDRLFIAVRCADPGHAPLAIHTLARDAEQGNDDHVTLVIDPFDGGRNGYVFQVNAGGARKDGLLLNGNVNSDWDGIWNAAAVRTSDGWTAEISISTQSLQFPADSSTWGFNIQRYIPRKQEIVRWASITLDADIKDLHRAGTLTGMGGLKQGSGLEVVPYGLVRGGDANSGNSVAEAGVDMKYDFTPELAGVLAVNPDFAEAEADAAQVNLSRFALYFPEKRSFFLTGANLFEFGDSLGSNFIPFYSRRIGLVDGEVVPLDAGVKVEGQAGPMTIGTLAVHTGSAQGVPGTQLMVTRLNYAVNDELQVGGIVTSGDPTGQTDNTLGGVDTLWHTARFAGDKNLNLGAWWARSAGDLPAGNPNGFGYTVEYPNDRWYYILTHRSFGDALDPALGFLPRPGTRQDYTELDFKPRPDAGGRFGWVRQVYYNVSYFQVHDLSGNLQSSEVKAQPMAFTTEGGYNFNSQLYTTKEILTSGFAIADGVMIPAGSYQYFRKRAEFSTPASWPWVFDLSVSQGNFYNGQLLHEATSLSWTLMDGHLALSLYNENAIGDLPGGKFAQRLSQLDVSYSVNPDLLISTFAQYDSLTDHIGTNTRLKWTIEPGSDLFVVWNRGVSPSVTALNPADFPVENSVIMKLRWNFHW